MTVDEMVGWPRWLDGGEFEQAPEVGDGQGSLVCCSPWGCKELVWTRVSDWTELNWRQVGLLVPQNIDSIEKKRLDSLFTTSSLLKMDLFCIIVGRFPLKLIAHLPNLIAYSFPWKMMPMKFLFLGTESLFWVMSSCFIVSNESGSLYAD